MNAFQMAVCLLGAAGLGVVFAILVFASVVDAIDEVRSWWRRGA